VIRFASALPISVSGLLPPIRFSTVVSTLSRADARPSLASGHATP
jgi:hypothetical protein